MTVMYVRDQGAMIRKKGEQLRVMMGEKMLFAIPLINLEQVNLMGSVQITTPAAVLLLKRGIPVVFMTQDGRVLGIINPIDQSARAERRMAQYRLCADERRGLDIARQIVRGKINNQRVILRRRAEEDTRASRAVEQMLSNLKGIERAGDLDQLRGYEGKAAAHYFDGVKTFFEESWGFTVRAYHPPPDPANALLSFAYMMLMKEVNAALMGVGLDPYLGFFHAIGYDRPSLALDLMEEFRPVVSDAVVLTLVRSGAITPADFEWTNDAALPVRMSRNAVATVVTAHETRLHDQHFHWLVNGQTTYRQIIELQARHMLRVVEGVDPHYAPHTVE